MQISERHSGRILTGLFVVDQRDPNFDLIYYAREGSIDESGTSLTMRDGEVHRKTPEGRVSIIKFVSYAFDLSAMSGAEAPSYTSADRSLGFLLNPDLEDPHVQRSPGSYRAELHGRLTEWLFPFMFGLLSLVVTGDSRSHRQARLHPMVIALALAFGLRWLGFSFKNLVKQDEANTYLLYMLPAITIATCSYLLATRRTIRMPRVMYRLANRMQRWVGQKLSPKASMGGSQ